MAVVFPHIYKAAEYVSDGLILHASNGANTNTALIQSDTNVTLSSAGLTMELRYRADSAAQDSAAGLAFGTINARPLIISNFKKSAAASGSDYGLNPFVEYGSGTYTTDNIAIDGLHWGDTHTYTVKMINNTMECYFDGVKTSLEHTGMNYTFTSKQLAVMYRTDVSSRKMVGKWFDVRIYNKALTDAEIAHNYSIDCAKYGG